MPLAAAQGSCNSFVGRRLAGTPYYARTTPLPMPYAVPFGRLSTVWALPLVQPQVFPSPTHIKENFRLPGTRRGDPRAQGVSRISLIPRYFNDKLKSVPRCLRRPMRSVAAYGGPRWRRPMWAMGLPSHSVSAHVPPLPSRILPCASHYPVCSWL